LAIDSIEQADMSTSSDKLTLEKIGSLSHLEESMDFEYEVLEVYEARILKLALLVICPVSYLVNIAQPMS